MSETFTEGQTVYALRKYGEEWGHSAGANGMRCQPYERQFQFAYSDTEVVLDLRDIYPASDVFTTPEAATTECDRRNTPEHIWTQLQDALAILTTGAEPRCPVCGSRVQVCIANGYQGDESVEIDGEEPAECVSHCDADRWTEYMRSFRRWLDTGGEEPEPERPPYWRGTLREAFAAGNRVALRARQGTQEAPP